ncbi:MAG: hypothetical protein K8S56_04035, partial [Candidatus Cloacimonetes bacterium]|nr:hypothetical protein [Candidatus Cloacimonadota bacterium]
MDKKKVCIFCFSELHRVPRVMRQILALKDEYQITAAGLTHPGLEIAEFIPISYERPISWQIASVARLGLRQYEKFYWSGNHVRSAYSGLKGKQFNLIIANDMMTLPLAAKLKQESGAKLLLDAHEYEPGQSDKLSFRLLLQDYWIYICRKYFPATDYRITSSPGFATEYKRNFNFSFDVVDNAPFYAD